MEEKIMTSSFSDFFDGLGETSGYLAEKLSVAFLAELNTQMKSLDVSNAELARRMDVSPAYITKVFRGPSNLSVETLAKLAKAVDCEVHLHLASCNARVRWLDVFHDAPKSGRQSTAGWNLLAIGNLFT